MENYEAMHKMKSGPVPQNERPREQYGHKISQKQKTDCFQRYGDHKKKKKEKSKLKLS